MRILKFFRGLEEQIGILLIYALIFFTALQVFFRYVMNNPLGWTEELARYVFIWSIFLGAAISARDRRHIRVELLQKYIPELGLRTLKVFNGICILAFLAFIIPPAFRYAIYAYRLKAIASQIPMFFVYVSLPLCGLLIAIHYIHNLYKDFTSLFTGPKESN